MARKWPEYYAMILDEAIDILLSWRTGKITTQERDDAWDLFVISKELRKSLIDISEQCEPQKKHS